MEDTPPDSTERDEEYRQHFIASQAINGWLTGFAVGVLSAVLFVVIWVTEEPAPLSYSVISYI